MGSGQTHTLKLSPLKQIIQGLIYLGKHEDPRKRIRKSQGRKRSYPDLPHPVNSTTLEPPGEVLSHLHPRLCMWWGYAGRALQEPYLLSLSAEQRASDKSTMCAWRTQLRGS